MEEIIHFSVDDIELSRLEDSDFNDLADFSCGVDKIDDFFHDEAALCSKYHYLIPYKCKLSKTGEIIGAFTLANDLLALEEDDKIDFPSMNPEYNWIFKRQRSYPAINIGHLAVKTEYQSKGLGKIIVDFVAATFANQPLAGCQFVTVDALKNPRTLDFYQLKLGFEFLTFRDADSSHHTRRMYLDIFTGIID